MRHKPSELVVKTDASTLTIGTRTETFVEGITSPAARKRLDSIRRELEAGWLRHQVEQSKELSDGLDLQSRHRKLLCDVVESITSESGRAIVGLCVLQLAVKAIEPNQSIRLHKGSTRSGNFSWVEGIPMRVIDKEFVTPLLREFGLLRLNGDGIFMTRSLAENYPFGPCYKAALRGARAEWLQLVDELEIEGLDAKRSLRYLLGLLWNASERFSAASSEVIALLDTKIESTQFLSEVCEFVLAFVREAQHSARLFEIAAHSFLQALEEMGLLGSSRLQLLSQMRSANKKHGNIADVEIVSGASRGGRELRILEAWDAKFDKIDLRVEVEELKEKCSGISSLERVGFIVSVDVAKVIHGSLDSVEIIRFEDWVAGYLAGRDLDESELAKKWLLAFVETICLRRRSVAPVDEPTLSWVEALADKLRP